MLTQKSGQPDPQTTRGHTARLTDQEFELLRAFVQLHTGIALGPLKKAMLQARLTRRLQALGLADFSAYHRFLRNHDRDGKELGHFVNAVTTNVTAFYREGHHFQLLTQRWLPARRARANETGDRILRFWSAGSSTGEEAYSIALTVQEFLGSDGQRWNLRILASDIDTEVLDQAALGIYSGDRLAAMPPAVRRRYFLRGTGANSGFFQVRSEIRLLVTVRRINLLEEPWPIHTRFDGIFCRNVLIYFDRPCQQRLISRFIPLLKEDGLLFLGHSESLQGYVPGLKHREGTIYQRVSSPAPATQG